MSQDLFHCGSVNALVYVLVILFGIASWVDINGLWVELPILVQNLPEGWDLPSYMAIIIQMANVAPLLYTLASWKWPQQTFETPVIYIIITLGAVSCLLLSMLWDVTSEIAGAQRSTALLVLQFFLALVDCTSSVAFLPFMFMLKAQYMTAYFIGEGFSGLVPSLVALGQGAGSMKCVSVMASSASDMNRSQTNQTLPLYNENNSYPELLSSPHIPSPSPIVVPSSPDTTQATVLHIYPQFQEPRFSVSAFFLILMVFLVISNISFTLLRYWGYCKKEYADQEEDFVEDASESPMLKNDEKSSFTDSKFCKMISAVDEYKGKTINEIKEELERRRNESKNDSFYGYEVFENKKFSPISDVLNHSQSSGAFERGSSSGSSYCEELSKRALITRTKFALFLILTAWLNALSNGVLPSIQTYSCLPYGIKPYHLSVTLAAIANPVACFAASFVKISSVVSTLLMTSMGSALAGYIIYTAAASPDPPLVGMVAGTTVLVLCWILVIFFLTYTKVCIATVFREGEHGRRDLLWVGAFTQMGSLGGALVTFVLVNVYKVFTQGNPCM